MLNIHNLSVSFGGTYLFEEVTFRLGSGDRVGLVGKNGAGKSTMLKILAGDFKPDSGQIATEKEVKWVFYVRISILNKEELFLEEAYQAFKILRKEVERQNRRNQSSIGYPNRL
jgi:ATP-binding cassette subfamily F protein 3